MIGRRRWISNTGDCSSASVGVHTEEQILQRVPSRPTHEGRRNTIKFEHEESQQEILIDVNSISEGEEDAKPSKSSKSVYFKKGNETQCSPTSVKDVASTYYDEKYLMLTRDVDGVQTINLDDYVSDDVSSYRQSELKERRNCRWGKLIDESDWEQLYMSLMNCKHQQIFMSADMIIMAESNTTVLHLAALNAPTALVLLMLEVITDCSSSSFPNDSNAKSGTPEANLKNYFLCGDDDGNTPLHIVCANLERTTIAGLGEMTIDFSVVKNLIVLGPEALGMENKNGDTPLHLLLSSNAFQQPKDHETSEAAISAAADAIIAILGMANEIAKKQNLNGLTPLHVAIANHCPKRILLKLLSMAPKAATIADNDGMNALHYVAAFGVVSWTFVEVLVTMYPALICQQTVHGDTPLHLLIANTSLAFFPGMTQDLSKTFAYHDSRHTMKLLTVLLGGNDDATQSLLVQNAHLDTPLHFCAKMNSPSILTQTLLESYHAPVASTVVAGLDMTPLRIAMSTLLQVGDSHDAVGLRNAMCNVVAFAIPESCECVDSDGLTPLMHAVLSKKWSSCLVKIILQADEECAKQASPNGLLALHYACQNNKIKSSTLKELIKAYPEGLKAVTRDRNTPLHFASMQGVESTIQLLIKKYPKAVTQRNADGEWPIDLAIKCGAEPSVLEVFDLSKLAPRKSKKVAMKNGLEANCVT